MNDTSNFKDMVVDSMGAIIQAHGLALVSVSDDEVILKSGSYALDIFFDRDGVSVVYFDTTVSPAAGYNLLEFLVNRRPKLLAPEEQESSENYPSEFVKRRLDILSKHFQGAAQDILGGSKDWIKSYSWAVIRPDAGIASLI